MGEKEGAVRKEQSYESFTKTKSQSTTRVRGTRSSVEFSRRRDAAGCGGMRRDAALAIRTTTPRIVAFTVCIKLPPATVLLPIESFSRDYRSILLIYSGTGKR